MNDAYEFAVIENIYNDDVFVDVSLHVIYRSYKQCYDYIKELEKKGENLNHFHFEVWDMKYGKVRISLHWNEFKELIESGCELHYHN